MNHDFNKKKIVSIVLWIKSMMAINEKRRKNGIYRDSGAIVENNS